MKFILLVAALLALVSCSLALNTKCDEIADCLGDINALGGAGDWNWPSTTLSSLFSAAPNSATTSAAAELLPNCPFAKCPAGFTLDPAGTGTCIGQVWTSALRDTKESAPDGRVRAYSDLFMCIHAFQHLPDEGTCGNPSTGQTTGNQCNYQRQDHTHGAPYPYQMRNCMEPFNTVFKGCLKDIGGLA